MDLFILFGVRKSIYAGEYGPEALLCWEEYSVDENPDGWEKALKEAKAKYAPDMEAMRVIKIAVDADRIYKLLVGTPTLTGTVKE
jgi:hypothetical protein